MKLDFLEQKKAMGQLRKKRDAYRITRQWHFDYNYSLCTIMVKKVLRHICISGAFFSVEYNFWRAK